MFRIILDTNIIVSGLITENSLPAKLLDAATDRLFDWVTSATQIDEIQRVTRRPTVKPLITPSVAGRFVNDMQRLARVLDRLPVDRSPDPNDNFLLAMADVSRADFLITGDKRDLLALKSHGNTRITTARAMLRILKIPDSRPP
jgi:putative PIN family toxin of toxin-antitoxin system